MKALNEQDMSKVTGSYWKGELSEGEDGSKNSGQDLLKPSVWSFQ